MKNYLPAQNQSYTYLQTNRSDSLGSLWSTMGNDYQSDVGTLRVAPRLLVGANTASNANMGLPVAFQYVDTFMWAIAGTRVFKNGTTPNAAWAEDASTGAVTTYDGTSDLEIFDNRLWATASAALYSKSLNASGTGAWTSRDTYSAGPQHPLKYFALFNRLYYQKGGGTITSIDTSNVVASSAYVLDLGTGNPAACLEANSTYLWIGVSGVSNVVGSVANIVMWDGISASATKTFPLKARYVLAMCVYEDVVYALDSNGVLNKFNGYAFEEIGRLPYVTTLPTSIFVQRNGMIATKNGTIQITINNVNGDSGSTIYENIPSGVWEWSEDYGFTHKYAFTYTPAISLSTITDFGQNRIDTAGALFDVSQISTGTAGRNGTILVGATYYTDASTTTSGIFLDDSNNTVIKKGYAVTTWFQSKEVQDKWSRLWVLHRRFLSANDSMVFKYRLTEEDPLYATITWTSTTTFTTTTDPTAYWTSGVGGEVEVLQGTGSGSCAHITSIVNNAGTYTVTLDTAITGVTSGTAKARFQKWIKLFPEITGLVKSWEQLAIGASDVRVQIKGCFTFTGNGEFWKFAIFSNEDIQVTA